VQQRIVQKIDEMEKAYGADVEFLNMAARTYHYLLQKTETALDYRVRIPLDQQWPEVLKIYDRSGRDQQAQDRSSRLQEVREKLRGQALPEFQLKAYDGVKVPFPVRDGKVSVLCFYMSTSEKSREMLRDLATYNHRYGARAQFYAVGVDRESVRTEEWLKNNPTPLTTLHNQGNTLFRLGVESVPTTYVVDASGTVRDILVGYSPSTAELLRQTLDTLTAGR
jgi:peroxiredoxin